MNDGLFRLKKALLPAALVLLAPTAQAGDAENIMACVQAAQGYARLALEPHEASYHGRFFSFSEARWPAQQVVCEVKLGLVFNLRVGNAFAVRETYAGEDAWKLAGAISDDTDDAIGLLRARIELLRRAREEAQERLRQADVDLAAVQAAFSREKQKSLAAGR